MSSQEHDTAIQRRELKKRLTSDITSLRTRGLGKPKPGDRSDLLKIAALYAPTLPTDTERIEALIETAITRKYGGALLAHVARIAFGADSTMRGEDHKVRYDAAWKAYNTGTYSSFTTSTLPKIGRDLAAQVVDIYEDGEKRGWTHEPPNEVEDELPPTPEAPTSTRVSFPKFLRGVPSWGVALFVSIGIAGLALAIASAFPSDRKPPTNAYKSKPLTEGTAINARSGQPVDHPDKDAPKPGDRPRIGRMTFCDLSVSNECEGFPPRTIVYTKANPYVASLGDIIEARFPIWAVGTHPIPYLRLRLGWGGNDELGEGKSQIANYVEWLSPKGGTSNYAPGYRSYEESFGTMNGQVIKGDGVRMAVPKYIKGSTALWERWDSAKEIAKLPDGIVSEGVYLANLGAPANCLCDEQPYEREVSFRFRLVIYRKG